MAKNMITDGVMDVWLHFRTGNERNDQRCLYISSDSNSEGSMISRNSLPAKRPGYLRFVIISDTHTRHRALGVLPEGDVFVHSGDILMSTRFWSGNGRMAKYQEFNDWLASHVNCETKIVVGGNHDAELEAIGVEGCRRLFSNATYLENNSILIESNDPDRNDLFIYGTPCSSGRSGNSAFQSDVFSDQCHKSLASELSRISPSTPVVLVSHGPCKEVRKQVKSSHSLKSHIWGHVHGAYGVKRPKEGRDFLSVCASIMDSTYSPTNSPIVMDLFVGLGC